MPASTFGSFTCAVSAAIDAFNSAISFVLSIVVSSVMFSIPSFSVATLADAFTASSGVAASPLFIVAASLRGSAGVGVNDASATHHILIHDTLAVFCSRSTKCATAPLDQPSLPSSASL